MPVRRPPADSRRGPSAQGPAAVDNRLIAGLPDAERARLVARCERVELTAGSVLHEAADRLQYAWFPLDCFLSVVTQVDEAADLGVRLIGREGMLGASVVLGIPHVPMRVRVQGTGAAFVIKAARLRDELDRSAALRNRLNAYVYVILMQLANSGVCFQHGIEARLARWLLMSGDCTHSDAFRVTHDYLARMLGVRRAGVTVAAQVLQARGLIEYSRGRVRILKRSALEASACTCYRYDKAIYRRVLGAA